MYKRPEISDQDCESFSNKSGLHVSNRNWKGEKWPIIKDGRQLIDTSYPSKEYEDIANKFKDTVLIFGLGFGKAVLDACANPKVKSITVVECNSKVIDLFWHIRGNNFEGFKKLKIVLKDAMKYKETKFKHVFIDNFHEPMNRQVYEKQTRELRKRFKSSVIHQIPL